MIGMARPPPTRPHIGINTPTRFSSYASVEWAEDDAWDSASDSESSSQRPPVGTSPNSRTKVITESSTAARPVPRPKRSPSQSSLTFSYTHVNAPSPSSYSPKPENLHSHKQSWTIVSKPAEHGLQMTKEETIGEEFDLEDVDAADTDTEISATRLSKERNGSETVRSDADEVVQGMH